MKKSIVLIILCWGFLSSSAFAYDGGEWIIRAGLASVNPNEDSDDLALNGTPLQDIGLPRSEAAVASDIQLGITVTKMLTPHWGIELLASTPFQHEIDARGLGLDAAEIKHLPPTLSAQYYFNNASSAFQPYVGAGINYTIFFDEEVDNELNNALIGLGATGDTELELDASLSYALQVGFDYDFDSNWLFNAVVWYIDINTEAEFDVPGLGDIKADVDIDPFVLMASVGYRF